MSNTLLMIDGKRFTEGFARKQLHRHGYVGNQPWFGIEKCPSDHLEWQDAVFNCQSAHDLVCDSTLGKLSIATIFLHQLPTN